MGYCIWPKWVNEKIEELKSKGLKVRKIKKFKGYHYFVQSSILQLSENIGNVEGFDGVKQKYGSKFTDISKEFDRILSKSKSRFAVGYATGSSLIPIHVEDIHKLGRRASLGILAYDTSFVLTSDIAPPFRYWYFCHRALPQRPDALTTVPFGKPWFFYPLIS
jgi:hypothetical protein